MAYLREYLRKAAPDGHISVIEAFATLRQLGVHSADLDKWETYIRKDDRGLASVAEVVDKLDRDFGLQASVTRALGLHLRKKLQAVFLERGWDMTSAFSILDVEKKGFVTRRNLENFSYTYGCVTAAEIEVIADSISLSEGTQLTCEQFIATFPVTGRGPLQHSALELDLEDEGIPVAGVFSCPLCCRDFSIVDLALHLKNQHKSPTMYTSKFYTRFVVGDQALFTGESERPSKTTIGANCQVYCLEGGIERNILLAARSLLSGTIVSFRDISPLLRGSKQRTKFKVGASKNVLKREGSIPHISEVPVFAMDEISMTPVCPLDCFVPATQHDFFLQIPKKESVTRALDVAGRFSSSTSASSDSDQSCSMSPIEAFSPAAASSSASRRGWGSPRDLSVKPADTKAKRPTLPF